MHIACDNTQNFLEIFSLYTRIDFPIEQQISENSNRFLINITSKIGSICVRILCSDK